MNGVTPVAKPQKIALGLSGGVDSAVAAHLLLQAGHEVTAVYIECWNEPGCRAEQDKQDALKVALQYGIPFKTLDFRAEYKEKVLAYFLNEYQAGRTPNPDVMCNKIIKFGLFYEWALSKGFSAVATGHYARIVEIPEQLRQSTQAAKLQLAIPADAHKDQTYFLNLVTAQQLNHIIFPLGDLTKEAVRTLAESLKLSVAHKKDSTGICFIGEINVAAYLKEQLGEKPGPICDEAGHVLGTHRGIWFYTIGQRHGFTVNAKTVQQLNPALTVDKHQIKPLYVIGKRPESNTLIIGSSYQTQRESITTEPPHWIDPALAQQLLADQSARLMARIRHTGELLPTTITVQSDNGLTLRLAQPASGVASGQSVVLYWEPANTPICICLGAAIIKS